METETKETKRVDADVMESDKMESDNEPEEMSEMEQQRCRHHGNMSRVWTTLITMNAGLGLFPLLLLACGEIWILDLSCILLHILTVVILLVNIAILTSSRLFNGCLVVSLFLHFYVMFANGWDLTVLLFLFDVFVHLTNVRKLITLLEAQQVAHFLMHTSVREADPQSALKRCLKIASIHAKSN